ncbi:uncharacterized protein LOC128276670 [Anopheles cruzii]|uniref:uncharacterized protein LOC128276670 n=1 Tax=Anopheles cruzii TaxID=68878 RepID=UPI0022EC98D1|nr:uncharacterized protein LOC128276670 [Anopheles cruzii]
MLTLLGVVAAVGAQSGPMIPNHPNCTAPNRPYPVYFVHPTNCSKFYECRQQDAYEFDCPAGLHFNSKIDVCDYPENAQCAPVATPSPVPPTITGPPTEPPTSTPTTEGPSTDPSTNPPDSTSTSAEPSTAVTEAPSPSPTTEQPTTAASTEHPSSTTEELPVTDPPTSNPTPEATATPDKPSTPEGPSTDPSTNPPTSTSTSAEPPIVTESPSPTTEQPTTAASTEHPSSTTEELPVTDPPTSNPTPEATATPDKPSTEFPAVTTPRPPVDPHCPQFGAEKPTYWADPMDCTKYLGCSEGCVQQFKCPTNLYWNDRQKRCDYHWNSQCTCPVIPPAPSVLSSSIAGDSGTVPPLLRKWNVNS